MAMVELWRNKNYWTLPKCIEILEIQHVRKMLDLFSFEPVNLVWMLWIYTGSAELSVYFFDAISTLVETTYNFYMLHWCMQSIFFEKKILKF